MQVRTLIRLIKGKPGFQKVKHHKEIQDLLRMNYSTKVSHGLIDRLLNLCRARFNISIEFINYTKGQPSLGDTWGFKINGLTYKAKLSTWSDKLYAETNALIYILNNNYKYEDSKRS